jgi:hypothetical protein
MIRESGTDLDCDVLRRVELRRIDLREAEDRKW